MGNSGTCLSCAAGQFANSPTTSCQSCEAGKFQELTEAIDYDCQACSSSTFSIAGATSCDYTETTCPAGTYSSGTASCISYSPLPDGNGCCNCNSWPCPCQPEWTVHAAGGCSRDNTLGGVFDDISGYSDSTHLNGGAASNAKQQAALAKYGPFASWDISQVTNMKYALASIDHSGGYHPTFNGDLSKWDVSRVTDMTNSKYSTIHNSFT